jgi:hypothetical protein
MVGGWGYYTRDCGSIDLDLTRGNEIHGEGDGERGEKRSCVGCRSYPRRVLVVENRLQGNNTKEGIPRIAEIGWEGQEKKFRPLVPKASWQVEVKEWELEFGWSNLFRGAIKAGP